MPHPERQSSDASRTMTENGDSNSSRRRERTSYLAKGMTAQSKLQSDDHKSSVRDSLLQFLEDGDRMDFLKDGLVRASNHSRSSTSRRRSKRTFDRNHNRTLSGEEDDGEEPPKAGSISKEKQKKRKGRKKSILGKLSERTVSNSSKGSGGTLTTSYTSSTTASTAAMEAFKNSTSISKDKKCLDSNKKMTPKAKTNKKNKLPTEKRVKAARQHLDHSLHNDQDALEAQTQSRPQHKQKAPILPAVAAAPQIIESDDLKKEKGRNLKSVSLERKSKLERRKEKEDTMKEAHNSIQNPGISPGSCVSPRKKESSRLAKLKRAQTEQDEQPQNSKRLEAEPPSPLETPAIDLSAIARAFPSPPMLSPKKAMKSVIYPAQNDSTTPRGRSLQRDALTITSQGIPTPREERRQAAKKQLEGISVKLERRRSSSGSVRLTEKLHSAETEAEREIEQELSGTLLEANIRSRHSKAAPKKLSPKKMSLQKARVSPTPVPPFGSVHDTAAEDRQHDTEILFQQQTLESIQDAASDYESLRDAVLAIVPKHEPDSKHADRAQDASLKILQIFESSLHSLLTQKASAKIKSANITGPTSNPPAPVTLLGGQDSSRNSGLENYSDVSLFAHSYNWQNSHTSLADPMTMQESPSSYSKQTLASSLVSPSSSKASAKKKKKKKEKGNHIDDSSHSRLKSPSAHPTKKKKKNKMKSSKTPSSHSRRPSMGSTAGGEQVSARKLRLPKSGKCGIQGVGSAVISPDSLRPKADLQGFLKHLVVLNDLKDLTNAPSAEVHAHQSLIMLAAPYSSECTRKPKRSKFQQMFQLKCTLLNILNEESPYDADLKREALLNEFDLNPFDSEFVLDHIELCIEENTEIRWDLVRTVFFPEDYSTMDDDTSIGIAKPPKQCLSGHESLPQLDFNTSMGTGINPSPNWNSAADFSTFWNSIGDFSELGKSSSSILFFQTDDEVEDDDSLIPREEYQVVILELYDAAEDAMSELSPEECQMRREILVQLLQATSEDEAHLTSLTLEDVAEIVHHVRVCNETDTGVHWDMIRDIVFPLGMGDEQFEVGIYTEEATNAEASSMSLHESCMAIETQHNWDLMKDLGYQERANENFRSFFGLTEGELDIVLKHIHMSNEADEPIRWDLIGEVLFPGDSVRQAMLSNRMVEDAREGVIAPPTADPTKRRQQAILSLSKHSWTQTMVDHSDTESGGVSFGGDDYMEM